MKNYVNRIILACPTMDTFAEVIFHLVSVQEIHKDNEKTRLFKTINTKEKLSIKEMMEFMDKINSLKDNELIDMNRDLDIEDFVSQFSITNWFENSNIKFYVPETIQVSPTFIMHTEFNNAMDFKNLLSNVLTLSSTFKKYGAIFTYAFDDVENENICISICKDGEVVDTADSLNDKKKYKELKKMIGIQEEEKDVKSKERTENNTRKSKGCNEKL